VILTKLIIKKKSGIIIARHHFTLI